MWPFVKNEVPAAQAVRSEPFISNSIDSAGLPEVKNDTVSTEDPRYREIFGLDSGAFGGTVVNEKTAMRLSAVHACVRVIADSTSVLPCHLYRETAGTRERDNADPLRRMMNLQPTPRFTAAAFRKFIIKSNLLRGDGFAYIRRNLRGDVLEIIPLHPDCVMVERSGDRLNYYILDDKRYFGVQQEDMLHFPGLGFDGVRSESVVSHYGKTSLGAALSADEHAARFFGEGTMQRFSIEQKGKMSPDAIESLRNQWVNTYAGTRNANKPLVLVEGSQVKELSMSASDAQLLETRNFSVSDIARFFGVPGHMIGHTEKTTSWGSGIEQMSVGFVVYTLQPHLTSMEQEVNRKLFPREDKFFEFDTRGLLRGDSKAQSEYFRASLGGSGGPGWMSVNEVRKLNNLPPVEDGDEIVTWEKGSDDVPSPTSEAIESPVQDRDVMTVNEARARAGLEPLAGGNVLVLEAAKVPSRPAAQYRFNELTRAIEPIDSDTADQE